MALKQESKLIQAHIREVQTGKSAAYEQLYRNHVKRLYSFSLKFYHNNEQAAEELTKRVFIKAYMQINSFPEKITFILWLLKLAVSEIRKGDIKKSGEVQKANPADEAIFSLPDEERLIFILGDKEKLSNEEISEVTGNSPEEINALLKNARSILMEKLNVNNLSDLDYKINFVSGKSEPRDDLWNNIYSDMHSMATMEKKKEVRSEVLNVGDAKISMSERLRKLKEEKKKNEVYFKPLGFVVSRKTFYTFLLILLIAAAAWYLFFLKPPEWEVINVSGSPTLRGNLRNITVESSTNFEKNDVLITNQNSSAVIKIIGTGEIHLNPGSSVKRSSRSDEIIVNSGVVDINKPGESNPLTVKVYASSINDYKPGSYSIRVNQNRAEIHSVSSSLKITSNGKEIYLLPGYTCETTHSSLGIPYFHSATYEYIDAVNELSMQGNNGRLNFILVSSEKKDALTLFNMLNIVEEESREMVINKLQSLVSMPGNVNLRQAVKLNEPDLQRWLSAIEEQN